MDHPLIRFVIMPSVDPQMEAAIKGRLSQGSLSCQAAWEIADSSALPRMTVASACETLGIKISEEEAPLLLAELRDEAVELKRMPDDKELTDIYREFKEGYITKR